jgi:hypothetical protein
MKKPQSGSRASISSQARNMGLTPDGTGLRLWKKILSSIFSYLKQPS